MREIDQLKDQAERLEERIKNLERDAARLPPDLERAHARVAAVNRDNKRQQVEIERLEEIEADAKIRLDDRQERIERLRAEKQVMIDDPDSYLHRMYLTCRNKTFLDAVKMVEGHKCSDGCTCCKFIIADELRRAAEGVKDV